MSEQIIASLKQKIESMSLGDRASAEVYRNALKEELQFYVLNFIYHHAEYGKWIMYGGSSLRIIHNLNRMSVDLDFEVESDVNDTFLNKLKKEIEDYFLLNYNTDSNFLIVKIVNNRGLLLKFCVNKELGIEEPSNQIHVKIDLNKFVLSKVVVERHPIIHNQFSFVILTYNMGSLMASKIVAILSRGDRGVGYNIYKEKGRDIYDLLWYMGKKIIPDFDYLIAKNIDTENVKTLFHKLTLKMNEVSDKNLKDDLTPLFVDTSFINNWLNNWRETYLKLLDDYKIRNIKDLKDINLLQDFSTDNYSFIFLFTGEDRFIFKVTYNICEEFVDYFSPKVAINNKDKNRIDLILSKMNLPEKTKDKAKNFFYLFYKKTEDYFNKNNHTVLGDSINTKLIRSTAVNFNLNEQILLNKDSLISCELDNLLK